MSGRKLHIQFALWLAFGSFLLAGSFGWSFYRYTYNHEIRNASTAATELMKTVSSSAAVGCYLGEKELLNEVV